MTDLKAKAIKIIENFPDDRMDYVLRNLESLQENFKPVDKEERKRRANEALAKIYEIMTPYRDKFPKDFDCKKEMQEYREERYGIA